MSRRRGSRRYGLLLAVIPVIAGLFVQDANLPPRESLLVGMPAFMALIVWLMLYGPDPSA